VTEPAPPLPTALDRRGNRIVFHRPRCQQTSARLRLLRRKFKTFLGELSMPGQIIDKVYTVVQWRGGFFKAVAGVGFSDYAQVNLKTSWG
jgi:hypothetical protein